MYLDGFAWIWIGWGWVWMDLGWIWMDLGWTLAISIAMAIAVATDSILKLGPTSRALLFLQLAIGSSPCDY